MSYMHINNLYKDKDILLFRECYAMEKIHGTSAHITFKREPIGEGLVGALTEPIFFAGGAKHEDFVALFNKADLMEKFLALGEDDVTVYGEAYGGKMQGMKATYGDKLRFVAFEVKIGESWLVVPSAESVARSLGLDFVHYDRVSTDLAMLDTVRDAASVQAQRVGITEFRKREGVVLRPLIELKKNNGARIMAKYKREDFSEVKGPRNVDAEKLAVLQKAEEIAAEWVTPMRLTHVIDFVASAAARGGPPFSFDVKDTGLIIRAMQEDVIREAGEEIEWSKDAERAVGTATAKMYKQRVKTIVETI